MDKDEQIVILNSMVSSLINSLEQIEEHDIDSDKLNKYISYVKRVYSGVTPNFRDSKIKYFID